MNLDQKHFPMLREYEKAKLEQQMNNDLEEQSLNQDLGHKTNFT
tara:strand:- start:63 stop:194 length:132 start_codon:yes stop_codon:yes gene_type:complete